jgi:allantoinase
LEKGLPLESIVQKVAANPALRFGIARKGTIEIGMDADLVLVRVNQPFVMNTEDLFQRHRVSPYLGCRLRGKVEKTLVRGQAPAPGLGRFVRPE